MNSRATAGRRHPGDDQTYARAHVEEMKKKFPRIGHHIDSLDRDLTEYCHYCKEPLELDEVVRDVGQALSQKPITLTRRVAARAVLPAKLVAWHVDRPDDVQRAIDDLNRRVRELEAQYPIDGVKVRDIVSMPGQRVDPAWHEMSPGQWWANRLALHHSHHLRCVQARRWQAASAAVIYPARPESFSAYRRNSRLYLPDGRAAEALFDLSIGSADAGPS